MEYLECWECGAVELHRLTPKSRLVKVLFRIARVQAWACDFCEHKSLSSRSFLEVDAYQPPHSLESFLVAPAGIHLVDRKVA